MEIRQLECFKTVCQELHFTRASEILGITQPTLSYQIKLLEDELGVPLFDRIGKKISLTAAGHILYKHCFTVFSSLASAREEIGELRRAERGTLSVAVLIGEINEFVSRLMGEFCKDHPKLQLRIFGTADVTDSLIREGFDFGVTILPSEDERFEQISLYEEDFYFVVSNEHPLAGHDAVDFDEIRNQAIVAFPRTHRCRQMIDAVCSVKGHQLEPLIETSTVESVMILLKSGAGASILSKTLLNLYDLEGLAAIPIVNPSLRREVGVTYLKDKYMDSAAREFIELLRQHVRHGGIATKMSV